jgi:SAM-dependent methyltransferase
VDPALERQLLAVEEDHYWFRGRRRIIDDVVRSLPLPPEPELLDAGCGGGRSLVELDRVGRVSAIEPSGPSYEKARSRGIGRVLQATLEEIPFPDRSFDLITCLDVIEHVRDDVAGLATLRRVVRPGGFLVVTVPAYGWLWSEHDRVNHHYRRYDRRSLAAAASAAGWTPLRWTYFNSLLLPLAAAYRLVERLGGGRLGGTSTKVLTSTPPWLNRALELPLAVEARLLRAGVRIPAGLSLLSVYRAEPGPR